MSVSADMEKVTLSLGDTIVCTMDSLVSKTCGSTLEGILEVVLGIKIMNAYFCQGLNQAGSQNPKGGIGHLCRRGERGGE